jgi:hypothetical protein
MPVINVKPNPARVVGKEPLKVFDPAKRDFIPKSGRIVPRNPYWTRRLLTGDVIYAADAAPDAEKKTAPKNTKKTKGDE